MEILPAIIGKDFFEIENKVRDVAGAAPWIHLDIVDGKFASPACWPYSQGGAEAASQLTDISGDMQIELHLMIKNPEKDLDRWLDTPAHRLLVHYESSSDIEEPLMLIDMSKAEEVGVVLNLDTPVSVIDTIAGRLDVVQLMSIPTLGGHGVPFDPKVVTKIKELRANHPELTISIDGGMNLETIGLVRDAGAGRVAVGGAIWHASNPSRAFNDLQSKYQ